MMILAKFYTIHTQKSLKMALNAQVITLKKSTENCSKNSQIQQLKMRFYLSWKSQPRFRSHHHVPYEIPHIIDI